MSAITYDFPWAAPEHWNQINKSIKHLIKLYNIKLSQPKAIAYEILQSLQYLCSVMDELCINTCPKCPDPCCLGAKIWFNFQDLLFLHLTSQIIPKSQPIKSVKECCCYSGSKGCALQRISRPWICTWYLCPAQTIILRKQQKLYKHINEQIVNIKKKRKAMEDSFISITS